MRIEELNMTFKELRKNCGYRTQNDLAKVLNIDYSTVSKWELGQNMPTGRRLIELSKVLGVSMDKIIDCFEK